MRFNECGQNIIKVYIIVIVSHFPRLNGENAFFKTHLKNLHLLMAKPSARHFIDSFHLILTSTLQRWHYYNHFPD